jgi:hypothetical protein
MNPQEQSSMDNSYVSSSVDDTTVNPSSNNQPVEDPLNKQPKRKHTVKLFLIALGTCFVTILVICFIAIGLNSTHNHTNSQKATVNPKVSFLGGTTITKPSPTEQTRVNEGLPPIQASKPLQIVNVSIPVNGSSPSSSDDVQYDSNGNASGYNMSHNNSFSINNSSLASKTITSSKNDPNYVNTQRDCAGVNTSNPINGCGSYNNVDYTQPYDVSGYYNYVDSSQFLLNKKVIYITPTVKSVSYFKDFPSSSKSSTPLKPVSYNNLLNGSDNYGGLECPGVNNNGGFYFVQDLGTGKLEFIIDAKYVYALNQNDFTFNENGQCMVNDTNTHYVIYSDNGYLDIDGKITQPTGIIQSLVLNGDTLYIYSKGSSSN